MKQIWMQCLECGKISSYLEHEDDLEDNYKTCTFDGRHREMKVIGISDVPEVILNKSKYKPKQKVTESIEELEDIMKSELTYKRIRGRITRTS